MWVGIGYAMGDTYKQVEVFKTEQEYIQFKEELADIPLKSMDIEVLASDPPIIVDYTIRVPRGTECSIGKKFDPLSIDGSEWILAIIGGTCIALGLFADFEPINFKRKRKGERK